MGTGREQATASLLDIARERVPGASLTVGDLEEPLPYDEAAFDVVTSFNSVQYAADPVSVVKGMSHVTRPGGLISLLVWGPPEQCQSAVLFSELGPLMPPAPPPHREPSPGARRESSRILPRRRALPRSPSRTCPTRWCIPTSRQRSALSSALGRPARPSSAPAFLPSVVR